MADTARAVVRHLIMLLCFWLPASRRKKIERWLRGREEFKKLQQSDWVLMSWGKSGRTWLRVMLSRAYQLKGGLDARELLDFDNLKRLDPQLPAVFFTHNNYLRDYTGNWESKAHFRGKRIVLLVRDPRDVAVSQFFQWQFRMHPNKKFINDYPPHGADIGVWEVVLDVGAGVPRIVTECLRGNNVGSRIAAYELAFRESFQRWFTSLYKDRGCGIDECRCLDGRGLLFHRAGQNGDG